MILIAVLVAAFAQVGLVAPVALAVVIFVQEMIFAGWLIIKGFNSSEADS